MSTVLDDLPEWLRDLPDWSDDERRRWEQRQAEQRALWDRREARLLAGLPPDED